MEHTRTAPVLNKELLRSQLRLVALDLPVKHTNVLVKKLASVFCATNYNSIPGINIVPHQCRAI